MDLTITLPTQSNFILLWLYVGSLSLNLITLDMAMDSYEEGDPNKPATWVYWTTLLFTFLGPIYPIFARVIGITKKKGGR